MTIKRTLLLERLNAGQYPVLHLPEHATTMTLATFSCPDHGEFDQRVRRRLEGHKCQKCAGADKSASKLKGGQHHIDKMKLAHPDSKYDYSRVPSDARQTSIVEIGCPVHGWFKQSVHIHSRGSGCPDCGKQVTAASCVKPMAHHLSKLREGYTLVDHPEAMRSAATVTLQCPEGHVYPQTFSNHTSGAGCPICAKALTSAPEAYIAGFFEAHGFTVLRNIRPVWLRVQTKGPAQELDVFVPELGLAIEYNGAAFHSSEGGYDKYRKPNNYHQRKWEMCRANGIRLINVYDFLWLKNKLRYLYLFQHAMRLAEVVYARKCGVRVLSSGEAKLFHAANHFEGAGYIGSNAQHIGLTYNGKVVMVYSEHDLYSQTTKTMRRVVQRISSLRGLAVAGGVSKLRAAGTAGADMLTTNDTGSIAKNSVPTGFMRYWWVSAGAKHYYSRNACQRSRLVSTFKQPMLDTDTEGSYMTRMGYTKVYDSGLSRVA